MAAQGMAPVSVDNLAAALSRVGSIDTLWTGNSSSAYVPGVSECSVVYVVTGPSYDSSTETVFTIIPGTIDRGCTYDEDQNIIRASVSGDNVSASGSYGSFSASVKAVIGIRLGGGAARS